MHWSAPRLDPHRWERKFALWPTRIDDIRVWLEFYEERFVEGRIEEGKLTGEPLRVFEWERRYKGRTWKYEDVGYVP